MGRFRGGARAAPWREFAPVGRRGDRLERLDTGGKGDSGDREADHLALTATSATDGVTHEENLFEVRGAEAGAAEDLTGAVLAAERNSVHGGYFAVDGVVVRGVGALLTADLWVELVHGSYFS